MLDMPITGKISPAVWKSSALLIISLGLFLRCTALGLDGLWMDEVFSASFANLNPLEIIIAVLRFDIHPPFYYLQLKLWSLPSVSDFWLLANSIAWSLGTLIIAAYGAYRLSGARAALLTAALLAVTGSEIYYATELRMYAMISCLTVIGWIRADIWATQPTRSNAVWLVGILGILAASHSSSFIPVSSVMMYALLNYWQRFGWRSLLRTWGVVASIGVLLAPWLINASMRSISHTNIPSADAVMQTLAGWALGYGTFPIPHSIHLMAALIIVIFTVLAFALGQQQVRMTLFSLVAWPAMLLALASFMIRPIWIDRAVAFCAPFLAISVALFLSARYQTIKNAKASAWPFICFISLCVLILGVIGWSQAASPRKMQYREAANLIKQENHEKLPIHVPVNVAFWGIARYLAGSDWGNLLTIQDAADNSETWASIYRRLGTTWLTRLGLVPKTRELNTPYGTMWIGSSPIPDSVTTQGFWLVGDNNLLQNNTACGNARLSDRWKFRGVVVVQCGKAH